jgi:hypothetical protein
MGTTFCWAVPQKYVLADMRIDMKISPVLFWEIYP